MNLCKKINSVIQNVPLQVWEGAIVGGTTALSGYLAGVPSALATLTTYLAGRSYAMPPLNATHQVEREESDDELDFDPDYDGSDESEYIEENVAAASTKLPETDLTQQEITDFDQYVQHHLEAWDKDVKEGEKSILISEFSKKAWVARVDGCLRILVLCKSQGGSPITIEWLSKKWISC